EQTATTSTGQTATGELYWNFGMPGVFVGLFVIGLFFGAQWRLAWPNPTADPVRFLLYLTLILAMPDMAEAGTTIVAGVYRILAIGALLLFRGKSLSRDIRGAQRVPV